MYEKAGKHCNFALRTGSVWYWPAGKPVGSPRRKAFFGTVSVPRLARRRPNPVGSRQPGTTAVYTIAGAWAGVHRGPPGAQSTATTAAQTVWMTTNAKPYAPKDST